MVVISRTSHGLSHVGRLCAFGSDRTSCLVWGVHMWESYYTMS